MASYDMETPLLTASTLVKSATEQLKKNGDKADQDTYKTLDLALKLLRGLDPYLDECSSAGPPALHDLLQETNTHDWKGAYEKGDVSFAVHPGWSAGGYEGALVALIARSTRAKRVLEVGMFTGTTTLAVADALPQDGKIVTLEIDDYFRRLAAPFFDKAGVTDRVDVRIGKALDSIKAMKGKEAPFDLIFIDADKGAYQTYFDTIMDAGLLAKDGVMLVDNTLYKGTPFLPDLEQATSEQLKALQLNFDNGRSLAKFNKGLRDDPRVEATILPVRDGVTWILHKGR